MTVLGKKDHWETIFKTKNTKEVSWFQETPETSLKLIGGLKLLKSARIIDVGCGDSCLPGFLLEKGYTDISAVDISSVAIDQSKKKMGDKANRVNWIVADITDFSPNKKFEIWHDRAVFHFLTEEPDIEKYVTKASENIAQNGFLIIATFSENGPDKCSGLNVRQYSEKEMAKTFSGYFEKIDCFTENHKTPSGSIQNFLFCVFRRK